MPFMCPAKLHIVRLVCRKGSEKYDGSSNTCFAVCYATRKGLVCVHIKPGAILAERESAEKRSRRKCHAKFFIASTYAQKWFMLLCLAPDGELVSSEASATNTNGNFYEHQWPCNHQTCTDGLCAKKMDLNGKFTLDIRNITFLSQDFTRSDVANIVTVSAGTLGVGSVITGVVLNKALDNTT